MNQRAHSGERVSTGVEGLDRVLRGGLPPEMLYLIHGGPGSGKTTLGLQFLLEGVRQGQRVLYASLLQTRRELEKVMESHHWSLDGIDFLDLPSNVKEAVEEDQTLFSPVDIELHEVVEAIVEALERHNPHRMVFDSVTELAVLVDNEYQLRRQILKLKQKLSGLGCTTFLTVNDTEAVDLPSIQTLVHGVIELGAQRLDYGPPRRWLELTKVRGIVYLGGHHDFRLKTGGIEVYPRVEPAEARSAPTWEVISSGNRELDNLFGGGLEEGSACLVTGTTGSGKTTLASLYVEAAARRGHKSAIFCFDERRETFLRRSNSLGLGIAGQIELGLVDLREINVGQLMPGEFAHEICKAVDEHGVRLVVIDSINGYYHAMPNQRNLLVQMHEILSYLGSAGALTLMVAAIHGITCLNDRDFDASYIADTVVLMRNFEAMGSVRRCISVLKKRHGDHEKSIREIVIGRDGVQVGPPLREFQGVLGGSPIYIGAGSSLLEPGQHDETNDQESPRLPR